MGRYRPPQPRSSPYITAAGAARLEAELKQLWKVERPQVTAAVQEAAKNGDRSENGDYIYGKKRLREIDRRVRYLSKRLENLTVVDRIPDNRNKVFFGAWVTVENSAGEEHKYRIVGADELDPALNYISVDSPMAKALLGKELDDEVSVATPSGQEEVVIAGIDYEAP
ncbi:transcription elongation factor GreB [Porticoccus sp. GXU_MW_L64]